MKIYVIGDVHGYWYYLNKFIKSESPDIILQCGDFGYYPNFHNTNIINTMPNKEILKLGTYKEELKKYDVNSTMEYYKKRKLEKWDLYTGIEFGNTQLFFCDGNHENHYELRKFKDVTNVFGNCYYVPRGNVVQLPDGRNVLFMGGAKSTDSNRRIIGYDWFPEETISQKDLYDMPDIDIDIVISHTSPVEFGEFGIISSEKFNDPSRKALSLILEQYKPNQWFFGHFHDSQRGQYKNTKWTLLDCANEDGWVVNIT